MKRVLNITWKVIQILIIIYVILVILFMNTSNSYGYSQIGKYILDVDNNEFLVIKKTDDIKDGDIVYYYSVVREKYKIVYSNVKNTEEESYILDNGERIVKSKIIGKSYRKIPLIGFILNNVKEKMGFFLGVIFPILIVFGYNVFKFVVEIRKKE